MEEKDIKVLCKCLGGSHLYGLNTPESDEDIRGVYLDTNIGNIIGLSKNEFMERRNQEEDFFLTEFRKFLKLLSRGNTECLELLFNTNWIEVTEEWHSIRQYRHNLVGAKQVIACLTGGEKANFEAGYIGNEIRLAMGERTGLLGSKRKMALDKYGFSPKNMVQLLRLTFCGTSFFNTGIFPARLPEPIRSELLDIKVNPEKYDKEALRALVEKRRLELVAAYMTTKVTTKFDMEVANGLCRKFYKELL